VELFPRGERLRVRGVQSGGKAVERAAPGQRTAVNLAESEHTALKRGMVLAAPGIPEDAPDRCPARAFAIGEKK